MTEAPRFSVVTAGRNELEGLLRTWRSLAAQTDDRFEWVVVDGASRDGTVEWLSGLKDDRVRWTDAPDTGFYDATNRGIRRADGDLMVFLAPGDTMAAPGVLHRVAADQAARGWRWGYGIARVFDGDGTLAQVDSFVPFQSRLLELGYRSLRRSACFFGRDMVAEVGWFDPAFGPHADQDFCIRAAAPAHSFVWAARSTRRNAQQPVGGHDVADATVTAMLSAELRARTALRRWVRRG